MPHLIYRSRMYILLSTLDQTVASIQNSQVLHSLQVTVHPEHPPISQLVAQPDVPGIHILPPSLPIAPWGFGSPKLKS